jgi:carbon-monoxide dehydrogenase large subunit
VSFLASRSRSAPEGVGKPVRRREDARLITGAGSYTDDVNLPGQAYASMVRSPHAHARIARIDTAPALATPGVLTVLTGADLVADGLKAMSHRPVPTNPHEVPLKSPDGSPFFVSDPLPLPVDRARFVGEPVAMVVAETALAARDGAERVTVEWEPLPAVVDGRRRGRHRRRVGCVRVEHRRRDGGRRCHRYGRRVRARRARRHAR